MSEDQLRKVSVMLIRIDQKEKNHVKFTRFGELEPKTHFIMNGSKVPFEKFVIGDYYVVTSSKDGLWTWESAWPINIEAHL